LCLLTNVEQTTTKTNNLIGLFHIIKIHVYFDLISLPFIIVK